MTTRAREQLQAALEEQYVLERELGRGGMATVYLARDLKHQRYVALKLLDPELGAVLGAERFLTEIRVTATLQHPHLLPLFDSGKADGLLYYVMPFVEGESLRARLERERQLPINEAIRIAAAVSDALDYAHSRGVVHRDLKPENILLQHGQPVVADFGIALAVSNAGGARVTQTGLSIGTPQYMSPEQATGDRQLDARSDIYSLGAVLYEMLAGEPPFTGGTVQAVIARVISDRAPSVRTVRPAVPEYVEIAVSTALEKVPADRWSSAREFSEALTGRVPGGRPARLRGRIAAHERTAVIAMAAMLGIAVSTAIGWWRAALRRTPPMAFHIALDSDVQLVSLWDQPIAISRDGQMIAIVGKPVSGSKQLFVKLSGEAVPRPLAGTDGATRPVFSPDGSSLTYELNGTLRRIPVAGGPSVEVPSGTAAATGWPPVGLAWSRTGTLLITPAAADLPRVIHTLPRIGGLPRPLTSIDTASGEGEQRWPVALEDGETILYTSYLPGNNMATARIGIASLKTGQSQPLTVNGLRGLGIIDAHLIYVTDRGSIRAAPIDVRGQRITGDPITLIEGVKTSPGGIAAALSPGGLWCTPPGKARIRNCSSLMRVGRGRPSPSAGTTTSSAPRPMAVGSRSMSTRRAPTSGCTTGLRSQFPA